MQTRLAVILAFLVLGSCAVGPEGLDAFRFEPKWRVEEQTGGHGRWEVVGTARFEKEEHCLAVIDQTQRCRKRL